MPIRSKGIRSKTRYKFLKDPRNKGVLPPNRVLAEFAVGSRVAIKMEPSQHKGMAHSRFHGLTGVVKGKQGVAFVLDVMHGNMQKILVVRAEHLLALT